MIPVASALANFRHLQALRVIMTAGSATRPSFQVMLPGLHNINPCYTGYFEWR
jgi:hypothetical protein